MAELVLISKILSAIASPAFSKAYEKGVSIWEARDELIKLKVTIETIQAVLLDAEKKQEGSAAVKDWIERLKGVLYDAEDLFDEVATEDLLKQQMAEKKNKLKQVRVFCSKLNPIVSRNSIAKKVKAIRKTLLGIFTETALLGLVSQSTEPIINTREGKYNKGCSIDAKDVIGRDEDKKAILEMLKSDAHVVIAIQGIGGMGKTTLARLIYNDEKVDKFFEKTWFACISDTSNEKEVLGKILQSMSEGSYSHLNEIQLEDKIRESTKGKKYLLFLDDVWEDHHASWQNRMSLLSGGAEGSKIVVTTRLPSVVSAVGAARRAHNLEGLADDDAWRLFKRLAFDEECEKGSRWEDVGRDFLKRCRGVPLAIWHLGSLLHGKTIQEWEEIQRVGLPTLRGYHNDQTMRILKLSYDHLPSNLKQCFTYCCLFPKDYIYRKELIYHWISQGYINPKDEKSDFMSESGFMQLLKMGFFQEEWKNSHGEILSCKMHDLMHDLAYYLGKESIMLSCTSSESSSCVRYASLMVDDKRGESWDIPTSMLNVKLLRACLLNSPMFFTGGSPSNLNQLCLNLKLLRTLTLSGLGIKDLPPSIGELKLMRYLDLSFNYFEELPDSITNLVNLLILNLRGCDNLKVWPRNFKKLINLRSLNFENCWNLMSMPEGIGRMTRLQYLSGFIVNKRCQLDGLTVLLKQLRGVLMIEFCTDQAELDRDPCRRGMDVEVGVEDEWRLELPADVLLQHLQISFYPGQRIWDNESTCKLESLMLIDCEKVKYLPPLRCLPILRYLCLSECHELEFMEEGDDTQNNATSKFFPCLEELLLLRLPKLKRWCSKVAAELTSSSTSSASTLLEFSRISILTISDCPNLELKSFPLCPRLKVLKLKDVDNNTSPVIKQELFSKTFCFSTCLSLQKITVKNCRWLSSISGAALPSLRELVIGNYCSLSSLHLDSPLLENIEIEHCDELLSIEMVEKPSLRFLKIRGCKQLKSLHVDTRIIASIEELTIIECPELRLSKTQHNMLLQEVDGHSLTRELTFEDVNGVLIEQWFSSLLMSSLQELSIVKCEGPMSLRIPSPHLQQVDIKRCSELTSVEIETTININIRYCPELKNLRIVHPNALESVRIYSRDSAVVDWDSIPNLCECSCINEIDIRGLGADLLIERLLPSPSSSPQEISTFKSIGLLTVTLTSLEVFYIEDAPGLKILSLQSQHLIYTKIEKCHGLTSIKIESPFARSLKNPNRIPSFKIHDCSQLKNVCIAHPIALEQLQIIECPELELSTGVDWDSLTNLAYLGLCPLPALEKLPQCLLQRKALGQLHIIETDKWGNE